MLETMVEEELITKAQRFYDEHLKASLEPRHNGEFVAIDPERELYAVAKDALDACETLRRQNEGGWQLLLRVGYPWTFDLS